MNKDIENEEETANSLMEFIDEIMEEISTDARRNLLTSLKNCSDLVDVQATVVVVEQLFNGNSNDKQSDIQTGIQLLRVHLHFPIVKYSLANYYISNGVKVNESIQLLEKAGEEGYIADAFFKLGELYGNNTLQEYNLIKAKKYFKKASDMHELNKWRVKNG